MEINLSLLFFSNFLLYIPTTEKLYDFNIEYEKYQIKLSHFS